MNDGQRLKDEGMKSYRDGRYEDAAAKFAEAQQAFVTANDQPAAAEALNNQGVCWRQAAKWDEAVAAFDEARAMFQTSGDKSGEGQVVGNLAALAESKNEKDRAAELYQEAIALFEEVGAKDLAKDTYTALSRLRLKQGNVMGAVNAFDAGLEQMDKPTLMQRVARKILRGPGKVIGG